MKLALIGFGQAGGKIVDKFIEYETRISGDFLREPIAVNTAQADLAGLKHVPHANRVLIGQARVKGHGVGADNELGAQIAQNEIGEIQNAIDRVPIHEIDAFLVIAALGGGTGSGGAPVLSKQLDRIYTEPTYGLGILPSTDEGGIYSLNAARSIRTFVHEVDNLMVFDNESWQATNESIQNGYDRINDEIVTRYGTLFSAGEVTSGTNVAESIVDSSEIINTLACGGISSIGYATGDIPRPKWGVLSRFTNDSSTLEDSAVTTNRITSLVRTAALGRLTLPCEIESTDRALLLVSGPSEFIDRKGIEHGRTWIEEETGSMEVRGGDYPRSDIEHVAVVLLLSGISSVPRIDGLQRIATEAQDSMAAIERTSEQKMKTLITDDRDELEPLF